MRFDDQVVLITGAAGTLGRDYAAAFAERGARLVLNDPGVAPGGDGPDPAIIDRVIHEITSTGGDAIGNTDDISEREGARRLVDQAIETYGRVDILVNNAGAMRDRMFKKMELDDFDSVVDVNLLGTAYVTHAAFPTMIEQDHGRIIMTTSGSALYGVVGAANYAAAKAGVVGLMNALRLEGERHNVLCNSIAPIARSRLTENFLDADRLSRVSPQQITPLVLFLASQQCATSGDIFAAGAGYFSRIAIMEGDGTRFDKGHVVSPDDIHERFEQIRDMNHARGFRSVLDAVDHMVEP